MASVYTLAQIIAGEAQSGNDADSFGVASTIFNRAQLNYNGYGTSAIGQAIAPSQFSAYPNRLGTPTAYQIQLAQAAQNGTLGQYSDTGNALFYNAPGYAYANNGSNAYGSGSNVYSDQYNQQPSSNFVLPQAGGTSPMNTDGDYVTMNPDSFNYGDITGLSVAGVNAPLDTPGLDPGGGPSISPYGSNDQGTPSLGGGIAQSSEGLAPGGAQYTGGGKPIYITDLKGLGSDVSGAGKAVQSGAQNAATGLTGTIASAINSIEDYTNEAFVVFALVVVGAIMMAAGLGLFKHVQIPIPLPV